MTNPTTPPSDDAISAWVDARISAAVNTLVAQLLANEDKLLGPAIAALNATVGSTVAQAEQVLPGLLSNAIKAVLPHWLTPGPGPLGEPDTGWGGGGGHGPGPGGGGFGPHPGPGGGGWGPHPGPGPGWGGGHPGWGGGGDPHGWHQGWGDHGWGPGWEYNYPPPWWWWLLHR